MSKLIARGFTCPITDEVCSDGGCGRDTCAVYAGQRPAAKDWHAEASVFVRDAALRILGERFAELNIAQDRAIYRLPRPKGMPIGPRRRLAQERLNRLIDWVIASPRYAHRIAVVSAAIAMEEERFDEPLADQAWDPWMPLEE
jgi:hypothetical protein